VTADIVDQENHLYHDSAKLAEVVYGVATRPAKFTKSQKSVKIIEL